MESLMKYPYEITEYYSPGLNSLKRIYTKHPKFNGNTRLIYELIFDYWNEDYGYAWPTLYELARDSGLSLSGVKTQIQTLIKLDLIVSKKADVNGRKNNVYYLKKPVSTLEEFYGKFSEIRKQAEEKIEKIDAEERSDKSRWTSGGVPIKQAELAENSSETDDIESWL